MTLKMCMDGSTSIIDLITHTPFTMAGTPTTASLLGVTAPTISATAYTSCTIPTATIGMTAGQALSIVCVVNTPTWAGNDGVTHYFLNTTASGTNQIALVKLNDNNLYFGVRDAAGNWKQRVKAATAVTWAAGTHIVMMTRAADGTIYAYLDGTEFGAAVGAGTGIDAAIGANVYIGTNNANASPLSGSILTAIYNRVLSTGEIAALSAMTNWSSLFSSDPNNLAGSAFITGHRISGYRIGPTNVGI
jgi:hypothetical protein